MPTYMVGSIRRRLEQSWWSSTNSNGCTPCMDLKEIYSQRSLDSDYMWHHSSCSESDDAEDAYREYELHSPASITSYDDADVSSLTGDNLPGSGPVAEENVYPSQNLFTLTWDQDESVFKGVDSVESFLDTSVDFSHSNATSNSNVQVTDTAMCSTSFPPCRTCQAHVDDGTSFSFTEDMNWLQTKTDSCTDIHKFDFGHSSYNTSSSRNLAGESDSCLTVDAKEEKFEAHTSLQDDNIAKPLPESYRDLDSVNEEFSEVTVVPPTSGKPLTCVTEDHDTIDATCMLLLEKVTEENGGHVLKYNQELSECSSAVLLDSLSENRHAEVHLMDTKGKVVWDNHNISDLNTGSHVDENLFFGSPEPLSSTTDSNFQNISNHSSMPNETVADDQSWPYSEALDVNSRDRENKMMPEVGNAEVSLTASQNSEDTATVICEDLPDTGDCLQFLDSRSPEKNSQIDLIDVLTLEGLPCSVDNEGSSISTLNEASISGSGVDSMSRKLCNLSIGMRDSDSDSAICQELQASATLRDPHTPNFRNKAPSENTFPDLPHIVISISEELCIRQVSRGCSESNSKYPPGNRQCSQFIDVMEGASDSPIDCGKESDGFLSSNVIAFSATKEQSIDFCAQLHNQSLSSDPFIRVNDTFAEKDSVFEKVVDEDGKSLGYVLEDMKQIPMSNFCMNEVERQSRENFLSKDNASNEDTKVHQIVVIEGKFCSQPMENQIVNTLWMEDFITAGNEQTVTEGEGKSLIIDVGETCCPCCGTNDETVESKQDSFVESCTGNYMNCCMKDKVQQGIDCKDICEVPKDKCLPHNGTVLGSLYAEESSISILHPLDMNFRESKCSEELSQEDTQKMGFASSFSASHPVVDISERQVSVGTWDDHLDQADLCASKTGGSEIHLASNKPCLHTGYLDAKIGSINPETLSHVCSYDSHTTANCDHVSSTDHLELGSSYVPREGSPCSTACVLDMKISAEQSIEVSDLHHPIMDDGANNVYHSDFAYTGTLKQDVEDGGQRTLGRPNERKREEAEGLESKPVKKILLKSFAGGMTVLGALFLLLQFRRRRRDTRNVITNIAELQTEKASQERRPDKDRNSRLYPAEKFKF